MTEHLGYGKHETAAKDTANSRNGVRPKTVLTETTGPVEVDVPRDREGTFEPVIVKKRQRRLTGVDEMVLSLFAKGLTTGEISAHFAEIYGASVSKETISRITDRVLEEMATWQNRPLDEVYAAIFIDAIESEDPRRAVKPTGPSTPPLGSPWTGRRTFSDSGPAPAVRARSSKMSVLTDIKNRGVKDTFFLVCDGLKGLPEVVTNVWPLTTVQTYIIFPVRNTFRLASKKDWDALKRAREAHLHGAECRGRAGGVGGAHGALGQEIRGDCAALGERVGGVHSVSGLDERNPARDLLDQRH